MTEEIIINVSKIDAAQRQLTCAIRLWFHGGDPVSIHTLTAAAYQIIHDLNVIRKTGAETLFTAERIKPEYRQRYIELVRSHGNFFKHADDDPDEIAKYKPLFGELFMFAAISGLESLGISHTQEQNAFLYWQILHSPKRFTKEFQEQLEKTVPPNLANDLKGYSKQEFFANCLSAQNIMSRMSV